jgi:hypothetical protein
MRCIASFIFQRPKNKHLAASAAMCAHTQVPAVCLQVMRCLSREPHARPTADQLLQSWDHTFDNMVSQGTDWNTSKQQLHAVSGASAPSHTSDGRSGENAVLGNRVVTRAGMPGRLSPRPVCTTVYATDDKSNVAPQQTPRGAADR